MKADHMHCMDAERLLAWILHDLEQGSALGIVDALFFTPRAEDSFCLHRYGVELESPVGVAAGPHSQLAQNIIAAWLTGARYIELKTVQMLDELTVSKPCIDMRDEGYNCEWSQELKLEQSYKEYLKAWVLLHILHDKLGFGGSPGLIFNMSAGYDLKGIQSPAMQHFLHRMAHAHDNVAALKGRLTALYPRAADLPVPGCISNSLTISCMHGCPPDEVERIALYFIQERRLHTTLKLNPTLLGAQEVRGILNHKLGYPTQVPDAAFAHDLVYDDAVPILKNCLQAAEKAGVSFSIKLTNTLETTNKAQHLPKSEGMVYMSGRALHAISLHLAARLQKDFHGSLDISFSAGVDTFNLPEVLSCGLAPVTMCSDLLKPGGYGRLSQYMPMLAARMRGLSAHSLDELVLSGTVANSTALPHSGLCTASNLAAAKVRNLEAYAAQTVAPGSRYAASPCPPNIKTSRPLPRFDCAAAPCMQHCPTGQHIPAYLNRVAHDDAQGAWRVIMDTNPFPTMQGQACHHPCQDRCTRVNYDSPVRIREIKRHAAEACAHLRLAPAPANGRKVAVIGAGPAGLSCAHYLALAGCAVTLYEAKDRLGGMAADAIPSFRLAPAGLQRDVDNILALGVHVHTHTRVDDALLARIAAENDAVFLGVGAQTSLPLGIEGEDARGVFDQLRFLAAVRRGQKPPIGQRVLVVGGGNSAMDVARTALRLGAEVTLIYRRTCAQMPCQREELEQALEEGVKVLELAQPHRIITQDGRMTGLEICPMRLECLPPDAPAGQRPRPVPCGAQHRIIPADSLIVAIGQQVRQDMSEVPESLESLLAGTAERWARNIRIGGDAARGAATLVEAIGDGRQGAEAILHRLGLALPCLGPEEERPVDATALCALRVRQARRNYGPGVDMLPPAQRRNFAPLVQSMDKNKARAEAGRCLQCDLYCGICVTVCPNRANVAVDSLPQHYVLQEALRQGDSVHIVTLAEASLQQPTQIVNIGDFCNECGNCAAFCPTSGAPYADKPRLHLSRASFDSAQSGYYMPRAGHMLGRHQGREQCLTMTAQGFVYEDQQWRVVLQGSNLAALQVCFKDQGQRASLAPAVEMALFYKLVADSASYLRHLG